jgi:hypothetical protein
MARIGLIRPAIGYTGAHFSTAPLFRHDIALPSRLQLYQAEPIQNQTSAVWKLSATVGALTELGKSANLEDRYSECKRGFWIVRHDNRSMSAHGRFGS